MRKFCFGVIILLECSISFIVFSTNEFNKTTSNINNCVLNIDNTGININILNNKNGYEFVSGNTTYILNICGPALKCRYPNASACIINKGKEIKIIGLFNKFSFNKYGRLKYKYDKKTETIIDFICNRHLQIPYIQHVAQLGHVKSYKFIFHTSLICVKLPVKCKAYDLENNLQYDLSSLYNSSHNWIVKNVSLGVRIYLNVCGALHLIVSKNNDCRYEGTQICAVDQFGNTTNLGVFSTELKLIDNGLSVNFTGGSLCRNMSIVTKLDFICSSNDSGPILLSSFDCEYNIVWHTPSACPYYSSVSEDCILHDSMDGTQKEPLYSSGEKEQQLSTNLKMKYNICGVLNETCNGQNDVSICLINNNDEIILGKSNYTLILRDANIYMNLNGELCGNKSIHHTVNIQYRCDYTPDKLENISISKDLCTANVTVFTSKVCRQPDLLLKRCTASANESQYDLTALILDDHNYEVIDPDDTSKVYLLNVCRPLVFGTDALCASGCAVCIRNNAEPNIYERFKSIGNYINSNGLEVYKNKLVIQYESSVVCPVSSRPHYKAVIEFRCMHQFQIPEITLSKSDCEYTFIWTTQYACPIKNNNITSDAKNALSNENIEKFVNPENVHLYKNEEKDFTTASVIITDIQETKIKQEMQLTIQNKSMSTVNHRNTISMYVPLEVPDSSGIFLKNCTLRDNFNELIQFNMYNLPKVTHVSSTSGNLYLIHICPQQTKINCATMRCLTNIHISLDKQFVIVNFTEPSTCNSRSYNSVIMMKCSHEFEQPAVIQEQECSVQLEWKNAAACVFLKAESHLSPHSGSVTGKIVIIFIAIVFIIVCITIGGRYYFVRKRRNTDSSQRLVQYSRIKDSAKIA